MILNVTRGEDGSLELSLPFGVLVLLQKLPARLRSHLEDPDFRGRVVQRLFPRAYDDEDLDAEYRKLIGDDLRLRKLAGIRVFERILSAGTFDLMQATLKIRAEEVDTALAFLNDMRLMLGTELDIHEEGWGQELSDDDPRTEKLFTLRLLSYLQEVLLEATGLVDLQIKPEDLERPPDGDLSGG